jgi:o-succinylbenzoate synthase
MHIHTSRLLPYRLPFRQAWRTSRGILTQRRGWIIELTTNDGRQGYGECAPLPVAGTESADRAHAWLLQHLPAMQYQTVEEAAGSLPALTDAPAARHALETALLDLLSQAAGVSLRRWLSPKAVDRLAVNGSAGPLDEQAPRRCAQLIDQGFSVLKLKVGLVEVGRELRWLEQLCRQLPEQISLRLDANGAWSMTDAQRFLEGIEELAIESLEEPLAQPDLEQLRALQGMTRIALALDESLPGFPPERLWQEPPVRRLILKPTVLGGVRPALALAEQAAQAGMESLVTSTLESALGVQAAAQLAAALPPAERHLAQGLATSEWFKQDLAEGLAVTNGQLSLPAAPGLGIRLKSEFIAKE